MKIEKQYRRVESRAFSNSGKRKYLIDNRPTRIIRLPHMAVVSCCAFRTDVLQRISVWSFNDENATGTSGIPRAAMVHYYSWRRQIRDFNKAPNSTDALDWDAHFERVGDHYTIRLNQEHRVHFYCDFQQKTVTVIQIGRHDL